MNLQEAVLARHSVRSYLDKPLDPSSVAELQALISELNAESGLHMQLLQNEPGPFGGLLSKIGWLAGVKNYLALVGPDGGDLDEKCGYYGERFVLEAQMRGINSCWVGGTYSKGKCAAQVGPGEKLSLVIALGYGKKPGRPHKSKSFDAVATVSGAVPEWFRRGVECALLAPTAVNQQKFKFELVGSDGVRAATDRGAFAMVDLGIAKYHFEIGAGEGDWQWVK